jgi:hypothetical protein
MSCACMCACSKPYTCKSIIGKGVYMWYACAWVYMYSITLTRSYCEHFVSTWKYEFADVIRETYIYLIQECFTLAIANGHGCVW